MPTNGLNGNYIYPSVDVDRLIWFCSYRSEILRITIRWTRTLLFNWWFGADVCRYNLLGCNVKPLIDVCALHYLCDTICHERFSSWRIATQSFKYDSPRKSPIRAAIRCAAVPFGIWFLIRVYRSNVYYRSRVTFKIELPWNAYQSSKRCNHSSSSTGANHQIDERY